MAQKILLKSSTVAGKIPTIATLDLRELAINTTDGKLFFKRSDNTIQTVVSTNSLTTGSINISGSLTVTGSVNLASASLSLDIPSGSIIFSSGSNKILAGNQSELYWDISNSRLGIGTTSPTYKLHVNGSFAAVSKSFIIPHPIKNNMHLAYGSLEGPEYGVYIRGELKGNEIILPDYWEKLIDEKTITVQLTPIKKYQKLIVDEITSKKIIIKNKSLFFKKIHCYYTIYAERKDIDKLQIEI